MLEIEPTEKEARYFALKNQYVFLSPGKNRELNKRIRMTVLELHGKAMKEEKLAHLRKDLTKKIGSNRLTRPIGKRIRGFKKEPSD